MALADELFNRLPLRVIKIVIAEVKWLDSSYWIIDSIDSESSIFEGKRKDCQFSVFAVDLKRAEKADWQKEYYLVCGYIEFIRHIGHYRTRKRTLKSVARFASWKKKIRPAQNVRHLAFCLIHTTKEYSIILLFEFTTYICARCRYPPSQVSEHWLHSLQCGK